jgi:hypothetical protein
MRVVSHLHRVGWGWWGSVYRGTTHTHSAADAENGASASGMAIESPVTVTAAPAAPAVAPVAAEAAEALPGGELAALLEELYECPTTQPTSVPCLQSPVCACPISMVWLKGEWESA